MYILPQRNVGWGLGQGIGQGLGSGLSQLAEMKLGQLQRAQQQNEWAQGYKAMIPGISNEQAFQLAQADPKVQVAYIKQMLQGPERAQFAESLQSILGGGEPGLAPEPYAPQPEAQTTQMQSQLQPYSMPQPGESFPQKGIIPGAELKQPPQPQEKEAREEKAPKISSRLPIERQLQLAKLAMEKKKQLTKQDEELYKRNDPIIKEISDYNDAARSSDMRLGAIERLTKLGRVTDLSKFVSAVKDIHIPFFGQLDLTPWLTGDEQTINKLSADFLRDVSKIFRGKIMQTEIDNFMKTIPTLAQSDEGRLKIIHNMRIFNDAAKLRYKAMRDVLKENKMKPPRYLEMEINDRIEKPLKELEDKFIQGNDEEIAETVKRIQHAKQSYPRLRAIPKLLGNLFS